MGVFTKRKIGGYRNLRLARRATINGKKHSIEVCFSIVQNIRGEEL
jgi:hypothetical protein